MKEEKGAIANPKGSRILDLHAQQSYSLRFKVTPEAPLRLGHEHLSLPGAPVFLPTFIHPKHKPYWYTWAITDLKCRTGNETIGRINY